MMDILKVASYIYCRYKEEYGKDIDEMKLHKLLYFAQRECIVQTREPLFDDTFEAWKYGPVMVGVRQYFKSGDLLYLMPHEKDICRYKSVFDKVFETYAPKNSWSLSSLTHGEYSWRVAREGVSPDEQSDRKIRTKDIAVDAERIRTRRYLLAQMDKITKRQQKLDLCELQTNS